LFSAIFTLFFNIFAGVFLLGEPVMFDILEEEKLLFIENCKFDVEELLVCLIIVLVEFDDLDDSLFSSKIVTASVKFIKVKLANALIKLSSLTYFW
jgi:hypothetical protein